MMHNAAHLIGHLGKAPEFKRTAGGQRYAVFSLATSETWRSKDGDRRQRTEWHRIIIWNEGLIDVCEKYLTKGAKVWIEGRIASRSWKDDAGADRQITEIIVSGFKGRLILLDRKKGDNVPDPDGEEAYGDVSEMERSYA